MNVVRVTLALLAGTVFITPSSWADRFDAVRDHIRAGLIEHSVPSITVAVAQDGKILWEEGFGWADREKRIPATEHIMYSLASISKPITTTGLMTLVQAGKVNLDAPANDYLGNAKLRARVGDARDATVRRLGNHTSGMPGYSQFYYVDEGYRPPSRDETIRRYADISYLPGERYQYSNLGYGVLDYIIERVSGLSYAEYMRREVFIPLGMTRTSVNIGPGLEAFTATRYGSDGVPLPFYEFDHPGASAVFSSAHDLVRFGLFHLQQRQRDQKAILTDRSIEEMHRQTAKPGPNGYGFGFFVNTRSGQRVVTHSGGMTGVSTQLLLLPDAKLAIVVLSNSMSPLTTSTMDRIASVMLPKWEPTKRREVRAPEPFVTPALLLGTWRGVLTTYVKELPLQLKFRSDGTVHAQLGEQLPTLVNDPMFIDGQFIGTMAARLGTPDADRFADRIQLFLDLRSGALMGVADARDDGKGARLRDAVPHWVELHRQSEVFE
ncbi:serine hydrolase domain-containing protein [Steroidobacter sp.]|uniref:serine hydrolase domain-containing protein n=1 Tax=Steroidobacter sp. TaxID=1978227 RepID=UPI001A589D69|nr:serine hydrolase domain-containing protein [Steroidobacter sp.]MBL8268635.1 beta-lactamase family protein [Steroidobacter sp.]